MNDFIRNKFELLSGTITTDPNFPAIILEQKWLNDKSEIYPYESITKDLYLFSIDYWSRNYLLDSNGDVFELLRGNLTKTQFNFMTWVENELQNFFKHPEKP